MRLRRSRGSSPSIATAQGGILLGCGEHQVYAQTRGGSALLGPIAHERLSFTRRLDEVSDASLSVGQAGLADQACCGILAQLHAFEHEISIHRDGVEVWVGPLVRPRFTRAGADFEARDLFQWFERRLLRRDHVHARRELADIFRAYVDDALSADASPNIVVAPGATGIRGTRIVEASGFRRAADELRELARDGLDFTTIGRTIRTGGKAIPLAGTIRLSDGDAENIEITEEGQEATTRAYVLGEIGNSLGDPFRGVAGHVDERFGLLENVYQEGSIRDLEAAEEAARTRVEMLNPPPLYVRFDLAPTAPVEFSALIPGATVELSAIVGCRELANHDLRLLEVRVESGPGNPETIGLTCVPVGSTE